MCPHEEKLTAWLLGDLSPDEHQALTRHLDACASCRAVKAELERVLIPLRSGLAKDREWHHAPGTVPRTVGGRLGESSLPIGSRASSRLRSWLWQSRHEGLKHAAILAVSFGTLFALISTVRQKALREAAPSGAVAPAEFSRLSDETPAPDLQPAAADKPRAKEAGHRADAAAARGEPAPQPAQPSPKQMMPTLRRLLQTDADTLSKDARPSDNPATAAAASSAPACAAPAKATAMREQTEVASVTLTQPVQLAGTIIAPTNTVVTNAVPTHAVAPNARHIP